MAIGSQFAGLDMKTLIGGPLSASAEASVTLAQSTADFINRVGFNSDKTARTIEFKFHKNDTDSLGNPINSEMSMEVPLLAIVPIPNLQIDEVNILFDMEVKECEKSESSLDASASFRGRPMLYRRVMRKLLLMSRWHRISMRAGTAYRMKCAR